LATQAFFSAYAVVARERRTRRIEFKRARQVLSIVAIVGLVGMVWAFIHRSNDDHIDYYVPATEVEQIETRHLQRIASQA